VVAAAIASYDPANRWEPVGSGVGHAGTIRPEVRALASAGSALFAGGMFDNAGGVSTRSVARWDAATAQWTALAGGVAGTVNALAVAGPGLYVGGSFDTAGGAPAAAFALWGPPALRTTITAAGGVIESDDGFRLHVPAGAVSQEVTVTYQEQMAPAVALGTADRWLRGFALAAHTANGDAVTQFSSPYTLQLTYSDAELAFLNIAEESLSLRHRDGTHWVEMLPCNGCSVDTANNRITVLADSVGEFALVGAPASEKTEIYLPTIIR
jgi:hypothetical protein